MQQRRLDVVLLVVYSLKSMYVGGLFAWKIGQILAKQDSPRSTF